MSVRAVSYSPETSSEVNCESADEDSPIQQVAQKTIKNFLPRAESPFDIKITLSRMILNHHPLDYVENDRDVQDIFCDDTYEGQTFLELAIQVNYVAAVRLLRAFDSVFIPDLPKFVLSRCEDLMNINRHINRHAELMEFKDFIIDICREQTLDPLVFIRYFLTTHRSVKDQVAFDFYRALLWTLMRMHMIRLPLVMANVNFERNPMSRVWYAAVLGIPAADLTPPPSYCSIQ